MSMIINAHRFAVSPPVGGGAMPTFVGLSTIANSSSSASISFQNSGRQAGDLLMIGIGVANEPLSSSDIPTGFTNLGFFGAGGISATTSTGVNVVYKISNGSETTISFPDLGDYIIVGGIVVRGVNQANPIHATQFSRGLFGNQHIIEGVTTTIPNCFIAGFSSLSDNTNTSNLANPNIDSITEQFKIISLSSHDGTLFGFTGEFADPGNIGNTTYTSQLQEFSTSFICAVAPAPSE